MKTWQVPLHSFCNLVQQIDRRSHGRAALRFCSTSAKTRLDHFAVSIGDMAVPLRNTGTWFASLSGLSVILILCFPSRIARTLGRSQGVTTPPISYGIVQTYRSYDARSIPSPWMVNAMGYFTTTLHQSSCLHAGGSRRLSVRKKKALWWYVSLCFGMRS